MDSVDENDTSLGESFLTSSNQYIVQPEEAEEPRAVGDAEGSEDMKDFEPLRDQDRFLPIANVARIMKKSIPKTGKIAKDAKECVQECVSEFVSFITSEASDRCHQEKRKTINGEDILFAMSTLGFDNYVEPLKLYLQKYRDAMKGDKVVGQLSEDGTMEEGLNINVPLSGQTTSNILASVTAGESDSGQQNVIYANSYPQLAQQLQFTT